MKAGEIYSEKNIVCDPYNAENSNGKLLPIDEREANAQAIVTAVNCAYGANINPEKIEGAINVFHSIIQTKNTNGLSQKEKLDLIENLATQALNYIKYKD